MEPQRAIGQVLMQVGESSTGAMAKTGPEMILEAEAEQELQCDLANLVQNLIAQSGDSRRILECYYWSQEPGLLELMRAIFAMPMEAQIALRTFLAASVVRSSITASIDASGKLTLRSPEAASLLTYFEILPS